MFGTSNTAHFGRSIFSLLSTSLVVSILLLALPPNVFSEVVGAHVTKIPNFDEGQASVTFEVCAGNNGLDNPTVQISSDMETKVVSIPSTITAGSCIGEATQISATDLSSIEATLVVNEQGKRQVLVDNLLDSPGQEKRIQGMSNDGKIRVEIITSYPVAEEKMAIQVRFFDVLGNVVNHVNYDIKATQNGNTVLEEELVHTHEGKNTHYTAMLSSEDPVNIELSLEGLGLPEEGLKWSGPTGKVIFFHAVPEFGSIVWIILTSGVIGVIVASYKLKNANRLLNP